MGARGWLLLVIGCFLWAPSCTTNHDMLAKRPKGGAGGMAGMGTSLGGAGFGGGLVVEAGRAGGGAAGRAPDEPPGRNVLTIVHGVVDAPSVRLCFRAGSRDEQRVVDPPDEAQVLAYGAAVVLHELDGVDFETDDLQPVILTGDLERISDLGCKEAIEAARLEPEPAPTEPPGDGGAGGVGGASGADGGSGGAGGDAGSTSNAGAGGDASGSAGAAGADPSGGAGGAPDAIGGAGAGGAPGVPSVTGLRLGELPVTPAGTLASGRSWLLALSGCIGGQALLPRDARFVCGGDYVTRGSTLGAVLVPMSRRSRFDALGLQVAHASVATGTAVVRSAKFPASSDASPLIAEVRFGSIAPRVARTDMSRGSWGAGLTGWRLEVVQNGRISVGVPWTTAMEQGGVSVLEDGRNYVVVLLGPSFELKATGPWNPPTITLVASEPESE